MSRRFAGILLACIAAAGLLAAPVGVADVRAAGPNLSIVTDARYDVQPEQHRVHVTLDMVLTNHLTDTTTKRFYFDRAFLSVLPATSGFTASWSGSGTPRAKVSKTTATYTLVELDLAQRLYSGKSATYRLVFDLVDNGGLATRDTRVGTSLVAFPVWAYATDATPGSSVRVVFPAGFQVEVESGDIPPPTTAADGTVTFQTAKLPSPLTFFAYLVADRQASYASRSVTTDVGGTSVGLTIRAWPDDPTWSERVGSLMSRGLPVLATQIGLPWPRAGGLIVRESVSRTTGGYAGLFDPTLGTIDVAYYADDFVVLHESAHAWFNGGLLVDRWSNEAFASYYGLRAADALGVKTSGDPLTPALKAAAIPLNAWGAIGRVSDKTEDYAYAATLELARLIAERAGPDALRAVWVDASAKVGAYQPPAGDAATGAAATPETVSGASDWRGLLDLLEEHAGKSFDDLWRTWVARKVDLPLLDARTAARARYDDVVAAAGDWQLPRSVRDAMRAWQFDQATSLLADATAILDRRTTISDKAAAAGLTVPDALHAAFERPDGFDTATLEATAELAAIDHYDAAVAARPAASDPLVSLGLWGTTPEADLDQARSRFAAGDLPGSAAAADSAVAAWTGAADVGRGRLVSAAALGLAVILGLIILVIALRGRRRRRSAAILAAAVTAGPYATLAATSGPVEPVGPAEVGDADAGDEGSDRWA